MRDCGAKVYALKCVIVGKGVKACLHHDVELHAYVSFIFEIKQEKLAAVYECQYCFFNF
jgi:hypothetical protein